MKIGCLKRCKKKMIYWLKILILQNVTRAIEERGKATVISNFNEKNILIMSA